MTKSRPLLPAFDAARQETTRSAGRLSYYEAGQGAPVLLLHSINAAASAYEVRPIFERLQADFHVYAPDLPGFGFSDRSDRHYDMDLYAAAVADMVDVIAEHHGPAAVTGIAMSLSSEFLVRIATERPDSFARLALIVPTGFDAGADAFREPGVSREFPLMSALFEGRPWSVCVFRLLTKESVVRYFLKRSCGSDGVDEELVAYDHLSARQPGAHHAPLAFLTGRLFSKNIRNLYEQVTLPSLLIAATRGDFKDFSEAAWAEERDNWTVESLEAGALPHFEAAEEFFDILVPFMDQKAEVSA